MSNTTGFDVYTDLLDELYSLRTEREAVDGQFDEKQAAVHSDSSSKQSAKKQAWQDARNELDHAVSERIQRAQQLGITVPPSSARPTTPLDIVDAKKAFLNACDTTDQKLNQVKATLDHYATVERQRHELARAVNPNDPNRAFEPAPAPLEPPAPQLAKLTGAYLAFGVPLTIVISLMIATAVNDSTGLLISVVIGAGVAYLLRPDKKVQRFVPSLANGLLLAAPAWAVGVTLWGWLKAATTTAMDPTSEQIMHEVTMHHTTTAWIAAIICVVIGLVLRSRVPKK